MFGKQGTPKMAPEKQTKTASAPKMRKGKQAGPDNIQPRNGGDDRHARIAALAYVLYERHGRQEGRDLENWLEAEKLILSQDGVATASGSKSGGNGV